MTDTTKQILGWASVAALLILAVAGWRFANAYGNAIPVNTSRSFVVQGQGKITAIPDVAQISWSVITEGGLDIASLQKSNTDKANKAIAFVKSKGVADKDIQTSGYNIYPKYSQRPCSPNSTFPCQTSSNISGYSVSQTVSVKIRDFKNIGDILSGVVAQGANSVSGVNFTIDNPLDLQNQARAKAIEDAQGRANTLAKAGHFGVGRLLSIDEERNSVPPIYYSAMGKGASDSAASPTIEAGSQDVTVNVTLRYEID